MLTQGCLKVFLTSVHWTNTVELKKRNDLQVITIIYTSDRLSLLRYNDNAHYNDLCTNWNIKESCVSHSLPRRKGEIV